MTALGGHVDSITFSWRGTILGFDDLLSRAVQRRFGTLHGKLDGLSPCPGLGPFLCFAYHAGKGVQRTNEGRPGAVGLDTLMGVLGASANALYC